MSGYATTWLAAFAITVIVELGVAVPLLARCGAGRGRRAGIVVAANLATHPLVWFAFPQSGLFGVERLISSEFFAVLIEAAVYRLVWPTIGSARAFGTSALANGASLGVGLALRAAGFPV